MTKCHHETSSFSNCRKRQVKENFAGGSISSNGGALLLREADRRIGLTAKLARALGDRRQRGKVLHKEETMIRQRVQAVALGYEDLNDHDALRDDPVAQTGCGRDGRLASSSTLCRFEQRPSGSGRFRFIRSWWRSSSPRSRTRRKSWCWTST